MGSVPKSVYPYTARHSNSDGHSCSHLDRSILGTSIAILFLEEEPQVVSTCQGENGSGHPSLSAERCMDTHSPPDTLAPHLTHGSKFKKLTRDHLQPAESRLSPYPNWCI